jgi:hypothetical protein
LTDKNTHGAGTGARSAYFSNALFEHAPSTAN